jgi:fructoselysine-6-P-deglycase FrlB-like protein
VLSLPVEEQEAGGFRHTLQEIRQQPELWEITARQIAPLLDRWRGLLEKSRAVVFTGSGSSHYAGECLVHAVQRATGLPACVISSGELLLLRDAALPPIRPLLMVSFARSGDSPESAELIRRLLEDEPEVRHLVITCNRHGRLAEIWGAEGLEPCSRVEIVTLDDRTCDRSLVMTSSFTNLEMTDGRVATMAETTLGFRHGPMCSLHRDALLVMFLSSDLVRRAYQLDLLEEIQRKGLGGQKILVGGNADFAPLEKDDLTIGIGEPDDLPDEWAALLCAVIGQLLAFFRCRAEGLRPDEPAANGAISRVVSEFRFHTATHHPR